MKALFSALVFLLLALNVNAVTYDTRGRYKERPNTYHTLSTFQTNSSILAGAGGSSSSNTTQIWTGTQSNRLTAGPAGPVIFQQTLGVAQNVCADSFVRVTYQMTNKANVVGNNRVDVYLATNASNYITYEFGVLYAGDTTLNRAGAWNNSYLIKSKFTQVGTFDCTNVTAVLIGLRAELTLQDTMTVGEVATYGPKDTKATIIFTFDDQWSTSQLGLSKLDSLGYRSTLFINPGLLGVANKFSTAQIDSLYARGLLDIGNHLWIHDSATVIGADSLTRSLKQTYNYLRSKHYVGASLFAWPYGDVSPLVDSVIRSTHVVDFARMVVSNTDGEAQAMGNLFAVRMLVGLGNNVTEGQMETIVNGMITNKTVGLVLSHKMCAGAGCAIDINTWRQDDFILLMNFIKTKVDAGQLIVESWGDYLYRYRAGVHPLTGVGSGR